MKFLCCNQIELVLFLRFKLYFFKAQYKSGAEQLASSDLEFVWIRKDELKNFIKNDNEYLQCLDNFILDF